MTHTSDSFIFASHLCVLSLPIGKLRLGYGEHTVAKDWWITSSPRLAAARPRLIFGSVPVINFPHTAAASLWPPLQILPAILATLFLLFSLFPSFAPTGLGFCMHADKD